MSFDYESLRTNIAAVISKFGQQVTYLRRTSDGTFDPATQTKTPTYATTTVTGVDLDPSEAQAFRIDEALLEVEDRLFVMSALDTSNVALAWVPEPGHQLTIGGVNYDVQTVLNSFKPAGTSVAYILRIASA